MVIDSIGSINYFCTIGKWQHMLIRIYFPADLRGWRQFPVVKQSINKLDFGFKWRVERGSISIMGINVGKWAVNKFFTAKFLGRGIH